MSNRNEYRDAQQLEPGIVRRYALISFGASGAPTLTGGAGGKYNKGIASISRTSTGLYVLTLQDVFRRTLAFSGTFLVSTVPAAFLPMSLVTDGVATSGAPAITFKTLALDNSATPLPVVTDPASGEIVRIEILLSNSSAL